MALPRVRPPRSRTNDLLDYQEVVADMKTTPGDWCLVAAGVTTSDADKIVRTLKSFPLDDDQKIELATRGATDESRNVYAVYTGPAGDYPDEGDGDDDDDDEGGDDKPALEKPKGVR